MPARTTRFRQSVTCEEATADLHGMIPKKGRQGQRDAGRNAAPSLAWYRGHQAGVYDVFLFLVHKHPRIAKQVLQNFGINEEGNMG